MYYFRNPMKPIGEKPDWQPVTYVKPVNYWKRNMVILRWLRWIAGSFVLGFLMGFWMRPGAHYDAESEQN